MGVFGPLLLMALLGAPMPASAAGEPDTCQPPVRPPRAHEVPPAAEAGALRVPSSGDPLGWLRPPTTEAITLSQDHVPLAQLPENASHEMIAASLSDLDRLRTLDLRRSGLRNLEPLAHLQRVEKLVVHDTAVRGLAPIAHLVELQHLDVRSTNVRDVSPLRDLRYLQYLALDETSVSDLSALSSLRCLEVLTLDETNVRDLRPVANLHALQELRLDRTKVRQLRPVAKLTALETLSLRQTDVRDVRPLVGLKDLKILDLADTQVRDIRPLARLTGLELLDIRGLPLTLDQVADLEEALPFTVVLSSVFDQAAEEFAEFENMQYRAEVAGTRFNLAQLLWESGKDRDEALRLARRAREALAKNGSFSRAQLREVQNWLRERVAEDESGDLDAPAHE